MHVTEPQEALAGLSAVGVLTRALPLLPSTALGLPVSLVSRLLLGEKRLGRLFAAQYISSGGLAAPLLDRCLRAHPCGSPSTLDYRRASGFSLHSDESVLNLCWGAAGECLKASRAPQ